MYSIYLWKLSYIACRHEIQYLELEIAPQIVKITPEA